MQTKNNSPERQVPDYEIMIRSDGSDKFASYCPQLNYMIKGTSLIEVRSSMKSFIKAYIDTLKEIEIINPKDTEK
jgi:hypothetical protein